MFESAALGRKCADKEYEVAMQQLRLRLFEAQRQCLARRIPVLITIAGLNGAGRGAVANLLSEWMDGKHLHHHAFWFETDEERERPPFWRYWRQLPAAGEVGVFLGGWYGPAVRLRACRDITEEAFTSRLHRLRGLENSLAASGMAIIKLWLHLDKKTFTQRLKHRLAHQEVFHFTPYDKKTSGNYDGLVEGISTAIRLTDRPEAPWTIVDAADANYRNLSVAQAIIAGMERAMRAQDAKAGRVALEREQDKDGGSVQEGLVSSLEAIDLSLSREPEHYRKELKKAPGRDFCPDLSCLPARHFQHPDLRGLGRGRQGRGHTARHQRRGCTHHPGHPHQRPLGRGAGAPLSLAILAAHTARGLHHHL